MRSQKILSSNEIIDYINSKITNKAKIEDIIKQLQKINELLESLSTETLDTIHLNILKKCPVIVNLLNGLVDKSSKTISQEKYIMFMYTEIMPLLELFCNEKNYVLEDNNKTNDSPENPDEYTYQENINTAENTFKKPSELEYYINNTTNVGNIYTKEIKQYKTLSESEEQELFIALKNGDYSAREKLINSNLRLVLSYVHHFKYSGVDEFDLIQEGNLGLMRAIESYDPLYGTKFSTYATHWILQKMRFFINTNNKIHIPIHVKERMNKYKTTSQILASRLGREPNVYELAEELSTTVEKVIELHILIQTEPVSLNTLIDNGDNNDSELEYFAADDEEITSPYELTAKTSLKESVSHFLSTSNLSENEKEIISLRYGLNTAFKEPLTLEEIAQTKGLTRERIRQIEDAALDKLGQNPRILNFLEYAQNPDLVERKMELRREISYAPFSQKYPTFCSYFPEYTEEEVIMASRELNTVDLELIQKANNIRSDNITCFYTKSVKKRLFKIICTLYDVLIQKYGRRTISNDNSDFTTKNIPPKTKRRTQSQVKYSR